MMGTRAVDASFGKDFPRAAVVSLQYATIHHFRHGPVSGAVPPLVMQFTLNATVDGQTTAHYITDLLSHLPVKVTRLAHGVPVGGELDYLDEGTLAAALRQRTGM